MTEKTITIEKIYENIADTIFVLDQVKKDKVVKFLKEKTLATLSSSFDIEEKIVALVRYCVENHKSLLEEIQTTEFIEK